MASGFKGWIRTVEKGLNKLLSEKMVIKIIPMRTNKKEEYWGTSVKKFIAVLNRKGDDAIRFQETGSIYLNLRDATEKRKLANIIIHELEHLLEDEKDLLEEAKKLVEDSLYKTKK
jgi:hypothetical protein